MATLIIAHLNGSYIPIFFFNFFIVRLQTVGLILTKEIIHIEKELLIRLTQGDENAFMRLYDCYHQRLYAWLLSLVKVPEIAQDIVQEAFLKIWEIRQRLNPEQSFPAFLYRISRNLAFKQLKKIAVSANLRRQVMDHLQILTEDPEVQLQWRQYQQLLNEAISQLPPQRRKVFVLCRQEGKSYDEVAHELGISRNTVKEHMVTAVKDIRAYFHPRTDLSLSLLMFFAVL